jgi:hypothetical protein
MAHNIHIGVNYSNIFHIPVRFLSLKNKVIHTQRITGDQTISCHRGRTFAQRFCPFDNLIENDPIQNFNRGKEEHKSGENEKYEHKKGELEPNGSKHFGISHIRKILSYIISKMSAKELDSMNLTCFSN